MEIAENLEQWYQNFQEGWLKKFQQTNEFDWDLYTYVKNEHIPGSKGIELSTSRLLFISSAGGYLPEKDKPFEAENSLGDYTIRTFPITTPLKKIEYAHTHYNQAPVRKDPQVLLPLLHLQELVAEKVIGSLCPSAVNFMGYQPNAYKVVHEMIPDILKIAAAEKATAALLVPS